MRILGLATAHDMVLAFLRAELRSPRFRDQVLAALRKQRATPTLIERPNTQDSAENALRDAVLVNDTLIPAIRCCKSRPLR